MLLYTFYLTIEKMLWKCYVFAGILIHKLKTAWHTKISMPFLSSLDNML